MFVFLKLWVSTDGAFRGGGIVSGPQEHRHYDEPLRWMYYEAIKAGILLGIPLPNRDWITNSLDTRATRFHSTLR